jgi:hypothetical protein
MNNNQLDALFVFSLLSFHTSTRFGHISSPPSGGRIYICGLARPDDSQLRSIKVPFATYIRSTSRLWAADMPETCGVITQTEDKQCIVLVIIHTIQDARSTNIRFLFGLIHT